MDSGLAEVAHFRVGIVTHASLSYCVTAEFVPNSTIVLVSFVVGFPSLSDSAGQYVPTWRVEWLGDYRSHSDVCEGLVIELSRC